MRRETEQEKETLIWHKTMWSTKLEQRALPPTHVPAAGGQAESTEIITQSSATLTKLENPTV